MNVALFKQVRDHLESHPENATMAYYREAYHDAGREPMPEQMCIIARGLELSGHVEFRKNWSMPDVLRIFDLTPVQFNRIWMTDYWPGYHARQYTHTYSQFWQKESFTVRQQEIARVMVERLDAFLESGGEV